MSVRINYQVDNLLHHIEMPNRDAAVSLINATYTAKMQGVVAFQLDPTTFIDTRALNMMKLTA